MKTPWLLRTLWSGLTVAPRIAWILFMQGPSAFCWTFGCWNLVWDGCHGTAEAGGNGRMCRQHCERACYHSYWRTNCEITARSVIEARLNAAKLASKRTTWTQARDVTPQQKTLKA